MSSTREAWDVLVVGAGLAGSVAACRAASLGCRVLLVDAAPDPSAGGNTALSGGSIHVAELPLTSPVGVLRSRVEELAAGGARPDLVEAFVTNSGRALAWLLWYGVRVEPPKRHPEIWRALLAPPRDLGDLHAWPGRGPQLALRRLHAVFHELGGEMLCATRIRELAVTPDRGVVGAVTVDGRHLVSDAVVLSDGGFQSNPELRKRYLGPHADRLFMRGSLESGNGDGLLMGTAVGAKLVKMDAFYGRLLHRGAIGNDRLWPFPFLDDLLVYGILVDSSGRRLVDEAYGGIAAVNAIAKTRDPLGTYIIVDEDAWASAYGRAGYSGTGGVGQVPANPEVERRGGVVYRGAGARRLAETAGIDPDGLEQTLDGYSTALARGAGERMAVPRSGHGRPLAGQLLAIPVAPAITFTMGGLLTDAAARVLDLDERPIPGLYAAGGTTGGLQGGPTGGYMGSLAIALIFGLLAGEAVARGLPERKSA